jgi:hypothetical protein
MTKQNKIEKPLYRPLKVYAFDPSHGRSYGNYMTINVPYEDVGAGPAGGYLKVIDYDASNKCYYDAVDLDDPYILVQGGLDPSESDPRFHQQMVYAVAMKTIKNFEFALGRKTKWGFNRNPRTGKKQPLRIFPHGMQEANAYYSRDLCALVFGYFPASTSDPGANLPGQTVFTCLSHDIIVHETTHALIDGQRMFFMEATSPDTLAFHEAFADLVALFQHFTFKDALLEMIERTGGLIYRANVAPQVKPENGKPVIAAELSETNPLVQLARQFGEAMGKRAALRSALGTPPNSNELEKLFEPHERGAILVAAVFDAFFTVYISRVRDLLRIARAGSSSATQGELHPDLANRLAAEATKTAEHFLNICIRALDYCPPVDIHFGDFLRAMITADRDLVRDDPHGYRAALIDAFRLRGIRPTNVTSYSEESLLWCPPEVLGDTVPRCEGLEFDLFKPSTRKQTIHNAVKLNEFGTANAEALGLTPGVPIQPHSFHPVHRVGPNGQLKMEIVVELLQQQKTLLDPANKKSPKMTFRGGVTLVIDQQPGSEGEVRYAVQKKLGADNADNERLAIQRGYFRERATRFNLNSYSENEVETDLAAGAGRSGLNFNLIHRGY